jgi:hypothetical protein
LWETGDILWKQVVVRCTILCGTDTRRERIDVMTITDWIIQLSIFGVLALAVVGTVQNLVDAMKKKS